MDKLISRDDGDQNIQISRAYYIVSIYFHKIWEFLAFNEVLIY